MQLQGAFFIKERNKMSILQLLATRNFITVNKELIKMLGLEEAIILGELASEFSYWESQGCLEEGYFYSTIENIEENTTLSAHKQRKAMKKLQALNILDIKLKGLPAKRYIKLNEAQILNLFTDSKMLKNLATVSEKIKELKDKNFNVNNNIKNKNKNNKPIRKKERDSHPPKKEQPHASRENDKEKTDNKLPTFNQIIEAYTDNEELREELREHLRIRKAKKAALTNGSLIRALSALSQLSHNAEDKILILKEANAAGRVSFYPLSQPIKKQNNKLEATYDIEKYSKYDMFGEI